MRLLILFLSVFILSALMIGNVMYESDLENQEVRDIYNLTSQPSLNWDNVYNYTLEQPSNKEEILPSRIVNVLHKSVDFFGFAAMESMKTGIEFGYENPQYDYNFAFQFFKWFVILMIVSALAPLLIPIIGLVTIAGMGIHKLIRHIKSRKKNEPLS